MNWVCPACIQKEKQRCVDLALTGAPPPTPEAHLDASSLNVYLPNEAIDVGEKIAFTGSVAGAPLVREATLSLGDRLHLNCPGMFGSKDLANIELTDVTQIVIGGVEVTTATHLIRAAVNGFMTAVVLGGFILFKDINSHPISSSDELMVRLSRLLPMLLGASMVFTFVYGMLSLSNQWREDLSQVRFDIVGGRMLRVLAEPRVLASIEHFAKTHNVNISNPRRAGGN